MQLGSPEESGRRKPEPISNSEENIDIFYSDKFNHILKLVHPTYFPFQITNKQ